MFKLPGKSAPVVPSRPPLTDPAGPTAVNNTAQPRPSSFGPLPAGEQGLECLPMEAWHESALPQPARESRSLVTRLAASIRALGRPPREEAPTPNHPQSNRLVPQPAHIAAHIASFLGDRDLHALAQTAHQFETIPASNPRFEANKALAERRAEFETKTKTLHDELGKLEKKVELLGVVHSPSTSSSAKIKAMKQLDPEDDNASVNTRIKQVKAELLQAKSDRYDMQIAMAAEKRAAQADSETKAGSDTSSSSFSSSSSSSPSSSSSAAQGAPMRPDQWESGRR